MVFVLRMQKVTLYWNCMVFLFFECEREKALNQHHEQEMKHYKNLYEELLNEKVTLQYQCNSQQIPTPFFPQTTRMKYLHNLASEL